MVPSRLTSSAQKAFSPFFRITLLVTIDNLRFFFQKSYDLPQINCTQLTKKVRLATFVGYG